MKCLRFAVPPEARRRMSCFINPLARSSRPCLLYTLRIAAMIVSTVSGGSTDWRCGASHQSFVEPCLRLCAKDCWVTVRKFGKMKSLMCLRSNFSHPLGFISPNWCNTRKFEPRSSHPYHIYKWRLSGIELLAVKKNPMWETVAVRRFSSSWTTQKINILHKSILMRWQHSRPPWHQGNRQVEWRTSQNGRSWVRRFHPALWEGPQWLAVQPASLDIRFDRCGWPSRYGKVCFDSWRRNVMTCRA